MSVSGTVASAVHGATADGMAADFGAWEFCFQWYYPCFKIRISPCQKRVKALYGFLKKKKKNPPLHNQSLCLSKKMCNVCGRPRVLSCVYFLSLHDIFKMCSFFIL